MDEKEEGQKRHQHFVAWLQRQRSHEAICGHLDAPYAATIKHQRGRHTLMRVAKWVADVEKIPMHVEQWFCCMYEHNLIPDDHLVTAVRRLYLGFLQENKLPILPGMW